jgi:hypothetical protein
MKNYEYNSPLNRGYEEIHLTLANHTKLFEKRPLSWKTEFRYYVNHEYKTFELENYPSKIAIVITVLLYPILLIVNGIGNYKEVHRDIYGICNAQKTGTFNMDSGRNQYDDMCDIGTRK